MKNIIAVPCILIPLIEADVTIKLLILATEVHLPNHLSAAAALCYIAATEEINFPLTLVINNV